MIFLEQDPHFPSCEQWPLSQKQNKKKKTIVNTISNLWDILDTLLYQVLEMLMSWNVYIMSSCECLTN